MEKVGQYIKSRPNTHTKKKKKKTRKSQAALTEFVVSKMRTDFGDINTLLRKLINTKEERVL